MSAAMLVAESDTEGLVSLALNALSVPLFTCHEPR